MTTTIPFRFGQNQGLVRTGADLTEAGAYRVLQDVTLRYPNAVEKRTGHVAAGTAVENSAEELSAPTAIWWRDEELCVEAKGRLYARQECGTADWRDVAPWNRYKQQLTGAAVSTGVVHTDVAALEDGCTLVTYEDGAGSHLVVISDEVERNVLLGSVQQPRVDGVASDRALISKRNGSVLEYIEYNGGTFGANTLVGLVAITPRAWDHLAFINAGADTYVWASYSAANTVSFKFLDSLGQTATWTRTIPGVANDLSLHLISTTGFQFFFAWAVTGADFVHGGVETVIPSGLTAIALFSRTQSLATAGRACAVFASGNTQIDVYVELDGAVNRRVQFWQLSAASSSQFADELLHAYLYSEQVLAGSSPAAWISLAGSQALRNGYLLYSARSGEVISRAWTNQTADATPATRNARTQHTGVAVTPTGMVLTAMPVDVEAEPSGAELVSLVRLHPAKANRPGNIDNVAVSAHAGYPRVYDGSTAGEYDWHALPEINLGVVAGSGYPAGLYSVAATWERVDRHGRIYRSAATIRNINKLADAQLITVQHRGYGPTEHPDVKLVLWRTTAGGSTYFRAQVDNALVSSELPLISLIATDADIEDNEQLDLSLLPSGPVPVTDFVAVAGGRLWSRNPQRDSVATFTVPAIEGFSRHFALSNLTELPNGVAVTGVYELDGRIVLAGLRDWAYTQGQGPSATGAGTYPEPQLLISGYGLDDYVRGIRSPAGIAFFSADGPKLLDRGLQVQSIGDAVRAIYADDGTDCQVVDYHPAEESVVWYGANGGGTLTASVLIWHAETNRWATWSMLGAGCAASRGGQFAVIDDGMIRMADANVYADAGLPYGVQLQTHWVTGSVPLLAGMDLCGVTLSGSWFAAHGLIWSIFFDFTTTQVLTAEKSAAAITAAIAAGNPYLWRLENGGRLCFALSAEIVLTAGPGRAARIEACDVHVQPKGAMPVQLAQPLLMEAT